MPNANFPIEEIKINPDRILGRILRTLPDYFGFEAHIVDYCECARSSDYTTFAAAAPDGTKVGVAMLVMNNAQTAQVWVMGVLPEFHGVGIGSLLMARMESVARSRKAKYIMAKTVGPSENDPNFKRTLRFYLKNGYTMLVEYDNEIWGGCWCALLVKKL